MTTVKQMRDTWHKQEIDERLDHVEEEKLMNLRCPYYKCRRAGDESVAWCGLDDHPCSVEYDENYDCETWNEIKKEWEEENAEV